VERGLRKRDLERIIESIPSFSHPKVELEQYVSPPHLVSRLIWIAAFTFNDIYGRRIIDVCSGTGRLGLAAAILGANQVLMVDIDKKAIEISWEQAKRLGLENVVDVVCSDVRRFNLSRRFDVAVQNPPFGVKRKGADLEVLSASMNLAKVIYSIHKSETKNYIIRWVKSKGGTVNVLFEETILLPKIYEFHYKLRHEVRVAVIRVSKVLRVGRKG